MYLNTKVSLANILLALSDALDLASPDLSQHQIRTAFIVMELAQQLNLDEKEKENLFIAALLHDIGALSSEEKVAIYMGKEKYVNRHCVLGERLLSTLPLFIPLSKIVLYHHISWELGNSNDQRSNLYYAQILKLADTVERSIDRKVYILYQNRDIVDRIKKMSGTEINPYLVNVFTDLAIREDFWLDIVSIKLYSLLQNTAPVRNINIDTQSAIDISVLFRNIIDFRSPFTATHSTGVASVASQIAMYSGYAESEIKLMKVAGNFHDIGKLVVPNSILNKPGPLTNQEMAIMRQHTYYTYSIINSLSDGIRRISEWAAFHHERLDGSGYPFHIKAERLNTGARVMGIADIFTALAEDRPYRKRLNLEEIDKIFQDYCKRGLIDRAIYAILKDNSKNILNYMQEKQEEVKRYFEKEFWNPSYLKDKMLNL